jgi:hypothetical protein
VRLAYTIQALHRIHVYRYTDPWHAQDRCPVANSIDCTGIEKWSAPHARLTPHAPVPSRTICHCSSGTVWKGSRGDAGRSTIARVGRRSIPSSHNRFDAIICKHISEASVYIQRSLHHVYVLPIHRSEAGMRKTGAQSLTTFDSTGSRMEAHRTRQCVAHPVLPLQVVELSEERMGAGRSTIACVGCAGRSVADRFDVICNNLRSEASVYIQQALHHVYDAADTQIRGMRKTGAQSLTTLTVQGSRNGSAPHAPVPSHTRCCHCSGGTVWKGDAGRSTIACVGCAGRSRQVADRFDAIICNNLHSEASVYIQQAHASVTCCRYTDQKLACARRCPVANSIDSTGIEKWKRTARPVAHPVLPLQVVELSGR